MQFMISFKDWWPMKTIHKMYATHKRVTIFHLDLPGPNSILLFMAFDPHIYFKNGVFALIRFFDAIDYWKHSIIIDPAMPPSLLSQRLCVSPNYPVLFTNQTHLPLGICSRPHTLSFPFFTENQLFSFTS